METCMENPLEATRPQDDPIARVNAFAYDLAWGVCAWKMGDWTQCASVLQQATMPMDYTIISPAKMLDESSRKRFPQYQVGR